MSRTTSRDLLIELRPGRGSRAALEQALTEAIRGGRLVAGTALPSSRVLARDLGMARSTVTEAYAQLAAAGYLTARQGAGTWVASGTAPMPREDAELQPAAAAPLHNLRPGSPDLSAFPRALWVRALRRALAQAGPEAFASGDPRGRLELRTALSSYLARVRGVLVSPSRIVVCNGFSQALKLVYDVLRARGARRVAMEDPSLFLFPPIATAAGLEIVPIPVDEGGLVVDELAHATVDAVLVTPAHQFPLGPTMRPERRSALLSWAARHDALVIEDDYDGEFRYDRWPIGAVQALDPERVVYTGTAAKTLAPGVRLAWLVMPPSLLESALEIRGVADRYAGVLDQLALAELIEAGDFDRHVRRMRLRYRRRRDRLVSTVTRAAPQVRIRGIEAGLHAILELPEGRTERQILSLAEEQGIGLHGLDRYRHGAYRGPQALAVGYGTPPDHAFPGAMRALGSLLASGL